MVFDEVLNTFENEDIKNFAKKVIDGFDPYIWKIPASSTGKYHPSYSLGDGGLIRHTIAVVRFLNHMFDVESIKNQYTSRERDLLRVAAIAHDSKKSGNQEDYEKSKWTKFDHPILAAKAVQHIDGLNRDEKIFIGKAIASHMGSWTTDKRHPDICLPAPENKYQIIIHLADYLASRRDIDLKFDKEEEQSSDTHQADINTWRFPWGKYIGKTIPEVAEENAGYIRWAKENIKNEPAKSLLKNFEIKSNKK